MNNIEEHDHSAGLPHAVIQKTKGISPVWIIPIVAAVIAAGLIYKTLTTKGPLVEITFTSAQGIEAGKTKIKFKDVTIGEVEAVKVSPDLNHIVVTARLEQEAKRYLTENTKFWVVRARFSGGIASGLSTLFAGSYIAVDPGPKGKSQRKFNGLEIPPVVTSDLPGRHFLLKASRLGSLENGSPIYFKGIKVGQVEGYQFSDTGKDLDIRIFIHAPFDRHVYDTTRFWFSSGLDVVLDAKGIRIDTQSLVSLMIGGLAFANPGLSGQRSPAREGSVFPLFNSSEDAVAMRYSLKVHYLLKFDNSVRGLVIGAPVEFRGFPIGRVLDISLEQDWEHNQMKIPVTIEVEPERIKQLTKNNKAPDNALELLVDNGLRAQLKTGNLLTGSKYVALDFFNNAAPATIAVHEDITEIPTIPASLDELTSDLIALMDKVLNIPITEIGEATLGTIKSLDKASTSFQKAGDGINEIVYSSDFKNAVKSLTQTLDQIQRLSAKLEQTLPSTVDTLSKKTINTLEGIEKITASDSATVFELKRALKEFANAARAISRLADHLEQHPESIIQGKGKE